MANSEKPAERALDGLSEFVRLAAEHPTDSPSPRRHQLRAIAYRDQARQLRGASQHAALSLAAHFSGSLGGAHG
jgi:hypothetical protein